MGRSCSSWRTFQHAGRGHGKLPFLGPPQTYSNLLFCVLIFLSPRPAAGMERHIGGWLRTGPARPGIVRHRPSDAHAVPCRASIRTAFLRGHVRILPSDNRQKYGHYCSAPADYQVCSLKAYSISQHVDFLHVTASEACQALMDKD